MGQLPLVAERASGDTIYDVDGHAYIDYCGSWGPLIHGHAHPEILSAVQKRMAMGTSFGITTEIEELLARKVSTLIPSVEKIRFVSSGTEATMSAIRLARGFTGRDFIIKYSGNYHGHADFFLVNAGSGVMGLSARSSSGGIPNEIVHHVICLPYNDVHATRHILQDSAIQGNIAAVILEPIAANMGVVPAKPEFIDALCNCTKENGTLLIFDEVLTGFRVGLKCAQGIYQTKPDLTCFGKIIGGGFPAAAFGGRREIMDRLAPLGNVYQAGTLSGNPVAMEAGYQTLNLLEKQGFYEELERKTLLITEPLKEYIKKHDLFACVQQVGSIFTLFFGRREVMNMEDAQSLDLEAFAKFFRFMFDNGVYIPPSQHEAWFVSAAHEDKNLLKTRDLILKFLKF
jgi:glutamate-1-semialdehyde 2,1-aminomutase